MIVGSTGGDSGSFGDTRPGRRVFLTVELEVEVLFEPANVFAVAEAAAQL